MRILPPFTDPFYGWELIDPNKKKFSHLRAFNLQQLGYRSGVHVAELKNSKRFNRLSRKDGFWNEPLLETEHFVVLPTLGMLVEGWLLIVPKNEKINFSVLSAEERSDCQTLIELLSSFFSEKYSKPLLFEHGPSVGDLKVGCGVNYAHLHLVPFVGEIDFSDDLLSPYIWERNSSLLPSHSGSYIHIDTGTASFHALSDDFPSQLIRRLIAGRTGQSDSWDWKKHYFTDRISRTVSEFESWRQHGRAAH